MKRPGVVLGIEPRASGRKVLRHRAVHGTQSTAWTGASSPSIVRCFVPWLRYARSKAWRYVFPRPSSRNHAPVWCTDEHISAHRLEEFIRLVKPSSTGWHDLRRGTDRALELVHTLRKSLQECEIHPSMPLTEIPQVTKNAIALRSNKQIRGSRNSYILDIADDLFHATRWLHLVQPRAIGGMGLGPDTAPEGTHDATDSPSTVDSRSASASSHRSGTSSEPSSSSSPDVDDYKPIDDQRFTTKCAKCNRFIGIRTPGALCDNPSCRWTLCRGCFPVRDTIGPDPPLLCPRHCGSSRSIRIRKRNVERFHHHPKGARK